MLRAAAVHVPPPPTRAAQELLGNLNGFSLNKNTEVMIAPPNVYLAQVASSLRGDLQLGAQVRV